MKKLFILCCATVLVSAASAHAMEWYAYGIGGMGYYDLEGDTWSGGSFGLMGGLHGSDEISFEAIVQYDDVGDDDYYFLLLATRYNFRNADFFLEPSLDLHSGILYPVGEKGDIDGVVGIGGSLLYHTHYGIDFGPRIESTLVFAGPRKGVMMNYTAVIGYRFR